MANAAATSLGRRDRNYISGLAVEHMQRAGELLSTPELSSLTDVEEAATIVKSLVPLREALGWERKLDKSHKGRTWKVPSDVLLSCLGFFRADRMRDEGLCSGWLAEALSAGDLEKEAIQRDSLRRVHRELERLCEIALAVRDDVPAGQ